MVHPFATATLPPAGRGYNARIADKPMPARMRALPVTPEGWPRLYFAAETAPGVYDLRVADERKRVKCLNADLCWLCGQKLGRFKAFVIGPMCVINRVTAEPPCHLECAEYACTVCPFLTQPRMKRNTADMPEDGQPMPGVALDRNPGATCIYITSGFRLMKVDNGTLIKLVHEPSSIQWWANGARCGRDPVMASIESGYPLLMDIAKQDGPVAIKALEKQREQAMRLVPAA